MSSFSTPQQHPLLSVDTETVHGRVEIVHARGAVDLLTGPELERCIEDALDKQPTAIIVDLTDVDFLASFGMSILLRTNERLAGTSMVVVADGPATSRPMEILGLTDVLTIRATRPAALEALESSSEK
jgi:anti-sigma B factor antagonist